MNMVNHHRPYGIYERCFKRFFDVFFSGLALVVLSPILIAVAILVRAKLGSPIFFRQDRPGLNGKVFGIYKFKTMLPPQTREGKVLTDEERLRCIAGGIDILSDEERLTKFGRTLRATSLDELPELWNIFNGDMSIVGPRPLVTIYLPFYSEEEMHRHDVRPGLTGLAQVNGRNAVSWENKFRYDLNYVNHITFCGDVSIILRTIGVVFRHSDIGQGSEKPEAFNIVRQRQWDENKSKV